MKKRKSFIRIMLLTIITVNTLSSCKPNPDTCAHDWAAPTCIEVAQCTKCGTYKAGGELGNHNYAPATCRQPAKCMYCNEYKDDNLGIHEFSTETGYCYYCGISRDNANNADNNNNTDSSNNIENTCANGHTNGTWVVTQQATLVKQGTEEMSCTVCGELIDSRTIQKKTPEVDDLYFNFTDSEFIDWMNSKLNVYVYSDNLFSDDNLNTCYKIDALEVSGLLMFNHGNNGKNGNIQAIMVYFTNNLMSYAVANLIGEKIDSNFNGDDAGENLVYGKSYSAANMTVLELELDDDFLVTVLAPTKYFEDL